MNLKQLQEIIENEFRSNRFKTDPQDLSDPLNYITDLGGKRVRPLLVLSTYLSFNQSISKEALDLARAVEMFHNFSLIHDDIMDRSEMRRGKPTVHIKWDEPTAILSGDLMLIRVYELLHGLNNPAILKMFDAMAVRLCEGQMSDMLFEKQKEVHTQDYLKMIEGKTAVLLAFALEASSALCTANDDVQQRFSQLGIDLGLAFQLRDDYLDSFGDSSLTGKRTGQDILNRKGTFLWNYMREKMDPDQLRILDETYMNSSDEEIIATAVKYMDLTGSKEACEDLIKNYEDKVSQAMDTLGKTLDTSLLQSLFSMLGSRVK